MVQECQISLKNVATMLSSGDITPEEAEEKGWLQYIAYIASKIDQPKGGYVNPKQFEAIKFPGGNMDDLHFEESITPYLVNLTVNHLVCFVMNDPIEKVFAASINGAKQVGEGIMCERLLQMVDNLNDDDSIRAAVMLSGFDSATYSGRIPGMAVKGVYVDDWTCENIRKMVVRSVQFFERYGSKVSDGLTFPGSYLTRDTLWNVKVSRQRLRPRQILQSLVQWRMGLHAMPQQYDKLEYLGIYNPRMNVAYRLRMNELSDDVINIIEHDVIGYEEI